MASCRIINARSKRGKNLGKRCLCKTGNKYRFRKMHECR